MARFRYAAPRASLSALVFGLICATGPQPAEAAVTIAASPSRNITCSASVCAPTASTAVLNAADLARRLTAGNVAVVTQNGAVQASDILIAAPLRWSTASMLTLDASASITIDHPVSVAGAGAVAIATGTGGYLSFGNKGSIAFANPASGLAIDGTPYTLVSSIAALAAAVAANPSGAYALANNYNAAADGTYPQPPVPTPFTGTFEGLGNTISHLSIDDPHGDNLGLFEELDAPGTIADLNLTAINITGTGSSFMGGLVGSNGGTLAGDTVGGSVHTQSISQVGVLAGLNTGTISRSRTSGSAMGGNGASVGGLAGFNYAGGTIEQSFSSSKVQGGESAIVGGLLGQNNLHGTIANSYATGPVTGGTGSAAGGLVGCMCSGTLAQSYSTGEVTGGAGKTGGLVGEATAGSLDETYWDTSTSGIENLAQGIGNIANATGVTGLSTAQLQSQLPTGFAAAIWNENPDINNGLPYLSANPPAKK